LVAAALASACAVPFDPPDPRIEGQRALTRYTREGTPLAHYRIGVLYETGALGNPDLDQACTYYRRSWAKAAYVGGTGAAGLALARCYERGSIATPQDLIKADGIYRQVMLSPIASAAEKEEADEARRRLASRFDRRQEKARRRLQTRLGLETAETGEEVVYLHGPITDELLHRFRSEFAAQPSRSLALNSDGGSWLGAMELGLFVHRSGYVTYVREDDTCLDACALLFLAGVRRILHDGTLGFARPEFHDGPVALGGAWYPDGKAATYGYFEAIGADLRIVGALLARRERSTYLPTEQELIEYGVSTQ
jgi:hypothetical protein